jgi:predicted nuclease of predicted toxin-antitoxin system
VEIRVVVTHDKDFGELAFRSGLPAECGVILLRLAGSNPDEDNRRAVDAIESRDDWTGHFSVITDDRIRMRPLT